MQKKKTVTVKKNRQKWENSKVYYLFFLVQSFLFVLKLLWFDNPTRSAGLFFAWCSTWGTWRRGCYNWSASFAYFSDRGAYFWLFTGHWSTYFCLFSCWCYSRRFISCSLTFGTFLSRCSICLSYGSWNSIFDGFRLKQSSMMLSEKAISNVNNMPILVKSQRTCFRC